MDNAQLRLWGIVGSFVFIFIIWLFFQYLKKKTKEYGVEHDPDKKVDPMEFMKNMSEMS